MFLYNIKLWNFRRFGGLGDIDLNAPNLNLNFTNGLNVLIGENDSGKSAILDAIKLVLKTHAYERLFIEDDDFFIGTDELRIELLIKGFTSVEASHFTEWLGWDSEDKTQPVLRIIYNAKRVDNRIISYDTKAGMDAIGAPLDSLAKEYLKVTFLRPLRDAENELTAKKYSRLSQILEGHALFKKDAEGKIKFEDVVRIANQELKDWFNNEDPKPEGTIKSQIKEVIDKFLGDFIDSNSESEFKITGSNIKEILEKLSLQLADMPNPGLGTMNRLYMAAELLHLQKVGWTGLRLCLVEEEEAHLHPQAQMKVLKRIQEQKDTQFIITTHSPNLASKVKLYEVEMNQVVICKNGMVFPMGPKFTQLAKSDYQYLDHFLDVTKANLFFAKGIILVEGWAEEIILPAIAKKIKKDFTSNEVSIVNVGSTAYMRFAKIFMRQDKVPMGCKVAIVTDLDIRPNEDTNQFDVQDEKDKAAELMSKVPVADYPEIAWSIAPRWTLEWSLYESKIFGAKLREAVHFAHPQIEGFKKDEKDHFNEEAFKQELINRLRKFEIVEADGKKKHKQVSGLDKVEVAYYFAKLLDEDNSIVIGDLADDKAKYLVDAINHVCS